VWNLLQTNVHDDIYNAIDYKHQVKPVHILRSIQLTFYTWFMHKCSRLTPPTLDLKYIWQGIIMQTYIAPKIPPQLYKLAYLTKQITIPTTASVPGTVATASLSSSNASSIPSDGLTVSALTTPTAPTPNRGTVVINTQPNAVLQALLPANYRIKELIGGTNPPQFDVGGEMCLSFLTRNTCWSNCKCATQHRADLNSAEHSRLEQSSLRKNSRMRPVVRNTQRPAPSEQGLLHFPEA